MFAFLEAVAWRQRWRIEEHVRRRLWPDRWGFVHRQMPPVQVTGSSDCLASEFVPAPRDRSWPVTRRIGDLGGSGSAVGASARLAGLEVQRLQGLSVADLARRATHDRWPVLTLPATALSRATARPLRDFLAQGGTALITGVVPRTSKALAEVGEDLGVCLPECRWLAPATGVRFAEQAAWLTRELAGVGFGSTEAEAFLTAPETGVLAWTDDEEGSLPVAWAGAVGRGQIVLSTGAAELEDRSERKWGQPLALLLPLMVLRSAYGDAAWQAPWPIANFTMDDPTLDRSRLGLDYDRVVKLAREYDFHLTVATIPRELGLADPEVVTMLRTENRFVSACYHGNDHASYEFYLDIPRHRFPPRSLAAQARMLSQAAARGTAFATQTGHALDRVMVFPHGICGADLLPCLSEFGFLATCNDIDRYPLGSTVVPDSDAVARPADLSWGGFPLLGRRPVHAAGQLALDLFLGKPAIGFTHRREAGAGLEPLIQRASELNRLIGSRLTWCRLEDAARHSYLIRRGGSSHWDVLMLANEICLHNDAPVSRRFRLSRPHLASGDRLQVDGGPTQAESGTSSECDHSSAEIELAAGATIEISVRSARGGACLPKTQYGPCQLGANVPPISG